MKPQPAVLVLAQPVGHIQRFGSIVAISVHAEMSVVADGQRGMCLLIALAPQELAQIAGEMRTILALVGDTQDAAVDEGT